MCDISKIKAVLFDMDGTVLDTEPIHTNAFAEAFKRLGVQDEVNFLERCIGLNVVEMRKMFAREIGTGGEFDRLDGLAWEIADEIKKERGIKVKDGFTELMDYLREIGAKSYIVTSTPRTPALRDLETAGVLSCFDGFVCFGDYEKGKPDPEPYLTALRLSGGEAESCIAVEDSPSGLVSAAGAGLRCVLIRDRAVIPPEIAGLAFADLKSLDCIINIIQSEGT